uniref:Beta-1,4-N-acetylgalactosaminyltransferase n=1 Tax=Sinocyclocheilus rhinocerous TaxID=307959 RepID=A0A673G8P2_9TELE
MQKHEQKFCVFFLCVCHRLMMIIMIKTSGNQKTLNRHGGWRLLEYKNVFICIYLCVVCLLQYKGMANLHIFEDWCGTSIAQLRKNLHYPLYPHNRTTVKKLAVSPSWTNYGLRIFGYIHPYTDGDFLFAVASDDNSEFWLSDDENPDNLKLRAYVGKTGREWTAPGEYGKYASQISDLIPLQKNNKYFFELIHKQNDKGTDHVEVAWRLKQIGNGFSIIDSKFISLYTNESSLKAADVNHIPQTIASHVTPLQRSSQTPPHGVDMLRADPRDSFHQVPLLDRARLLGVLPDCIYNPSYSIKGYPLMRYQGLQFVHLTYVYPNDYTRLTHMENDNKCFYHGNPYYLERIRKKREDRDLNNKFQQMDQDNQPKEIQKPPGEPQNHPEEPQQQPRKKKKRRRPEQNLQDQHYLQNPPSEVKNYDLGKEKDSQRFQNNIMEKIPDQKNPGPAQREDRSRSKVKQQAVEDDNNIIKHENVAHHLQITQHQHQNSSNKASVIAAPSNEEYNSRWGHVNDVRKEKEIQDNAIHIEEVEDGGNEEDSWVNQGFSEEEDYDLTNRVVYDVEVKWCQTFQAKPLDLHALRSDWIDLKCNVSGNLLLEESEALSVVEALMKKLNKKYPRQFSLERIVNIEKKPDYNRGSRYLLELELLEASGRHLRLVQYIYVKRTEDWGSHKKQNAQGEELKLCNPYSFYWNPTATVHFIIPVKNQARWVQQFISDMEEIYRTTGDQNFNVIITDYESTDMNVEQALQNSYLPRYQYLRLSGNFERSAGLQAGIDLITDDHSIVFLCDLHIHFPPGFIDTVRKHCVERHMAFAPIVMRLNCGATPLEPDGYWEVNGFGLLGIYKSDLDSIGGMNTKEFTDRWGGEDWELLDRILQGGLEVERLYLRNFFHHFHSKRGMWNRQMLRNT